MCAERWAAQTGFLTHAKAGARGDPSYHRGDARLPRQHDLDLCPDGRAGAAATIGAEIDRKSTRLNSSHMSISYAVFCLKKKKKKKQNIHSRQTKDTHGD